MSSAVQCKGNSSVRIECLGCVCVFMCLCVCVCVCACAFVFLYRYGQRCCARKGNKQIINGYNNKRDLI